MGQTSIPDQMTAVAVKDGKGPAEALHVVEPPTPAPGPGQVLVRVEAGVDAGVLHRAGTDQE